MALPLRAKRLALFGDVSNFSFYFGHHMTTIEGGMICTNDDNIKNNMQKCFVHGMTRLDYSKSSEIGRNLQKIRGTLSYLNPLFTFAVPGYNMRNHNQMVVLGSSQLKRLDLYIQMRIENFELWINSLIRINIL